MTQRSTKNRTRLMAVPSRNGSLTVSKDRARQILHRTGFTVGQIDEILAQLPDPFDVDRCDRILRGYGASLDALMDRMGASP